MPNLNTSSSSSTERLIAILQSAVRRLRWQESLRLIGPVLCGGLLATLLLILAGYLYPLALPLWLLTIGLSLTLMALLGALIYAWVRPHPPATVARLLDRRLELEERLATALELLSHDQPTPPQIKQAQLANTLQQLQSFEPARALPGQFSFRWFGLNGLLMAAIAAGLLWPNPQLAILRQQAQLQETMAEQAEQFEAIRAELLADPILPETPQGEALLQTLDDLVKELQTNNLSPEEALAALSEAEQKLAALKNMSAQREATLNDLAQTFNQFPSTADLAEALQERDFSRAAEMMASAGNEFEAEPETASELAAALQQAAQTAQQAGDEELAEALNQAAEALEEALNQGGDAQAAQEALQQAAQALEEAGEQLANQEALEEALANIQGAREQLAEQGGQAESGQGEQAGQGQAGGSGLAEGQPQENSGGAGREDPGRAPENLYADQPAPDRMSTGNGPNEGRAGEYESLYAPQHLGGEGGPLVKPAEQGAEGGLPIGNAPVDPNQEPGPALTPYDQVYGQYSEAASQALDDTYIPLGMKDYIRQYFGALEPGSE